MGIVLGSFGAFQGNIWSVAPFVPAGPSENQWKKHKKCIYSKIAKQNELKFKISTPTYGRMIYPALGM